nr:hypothetical protein [uncultured Rhodopila sp.]
MSEYQYYEFQAADRPLTPADRQALRSLSSRATITATSFTNEYNFGDFRGDPVKLMQTWFDLHAYVANWGSRRLMIRLPARLLDRPFVDHIGDAADCLTVIEAGDNFILDIRRNDEEGGESVEDGPGWLASLAPLRADLLGGDSRVLYLLWLMAVEAEGIEPDEPEPLPGIGPMTDALEAFVNFFGIDPDLAAAAAERVSMEQIAPGAAQAVIAAMDGPGKNALLLRLFESDPLAAADLRAAVRQGQPGAPQAARRTAAELLARAEVQREEREAAEARKSAEQRRLADERARKEERARRDALIRRGEAVWREIEADIETSSAKGYTAAASLLSEMREIAEERGQTVDFARRLVAIRERHERKKQFLIRIRGLE